MKCVDKCIARHRPRCNFTTIHDIHEAYDIEFTKDLCHPAFIVSVASLYILQ